MFWSKTTIKPVISRIRYFDTGLLDTDTIMVKVNEKQYNEIEKALQHEKKKKEWRQNIKKF